MAKKRIQLDPSREGAEQLLASYRMYGRVRCDGAAWVAFSGQPTGQTVAIVRPATQASADDPLADLHTVYWRTKGEGVVFPVLRDIEGPDTK